MDVKTRPGADISPEYCYRDARAAIAFLERAFAFEPRLVVPGENDSVAHAELRVGDDFILVGSLRDDGSFHYRTPLDIGGVTTGSAYVARDDIVATYERAKRAGARLVRELADTDYGSTDFSARDPEGFLWHFGTYRPTIAGEAAAGAPKVYAGQRYEDARAAMEFLARAFGFTEHFVVAGDGDEIAHAQMQLGNAIVMLGSNRRDEFLTRTPLELGGGYTQSLCAYVADPDAHHARALDAGADIIAAPTDTSYGARGYVVRDREGYVWNFSTYRPAR